MATVKIVFCVDQECTDLLDDLGLEYDADEDRGHIEVPLEVDEDLLESLTTDELAEFFGLETEFVIALEVLD
jgi:hypothetical protein